jgi:DNA-directed RNA polymerase subunit RPC12/RpoP
VTTFACEQCGAHLAFAGVRTARCPYCASPSFVERPPSAGQPDLRFVVAFAGDAVSARCSLERWLGSRHWFVDPALRVARIEDLRGIYVPAYLYSAVAHTEYTASIAEHYHEQETRKRDDGTTETRTVTRTEYRPLSGRHVSYVTDVLVSASQGLSHGELGAIEPFDFRQMRRFTPALVSGWIVEEVARPLEECRVASHREALDEVGARLRRFMPGDGFSDLHWHAEISWESLDPVLVPVWMFAVRYRGDRPPLRVAINGQTGRIAGKVPLAWPRIVAALVLLVATALAVWWRLR